MIPGNNPFKRTNSSTQSTASQSADQMETTARIPTKLALPTPNRRASAKKVTSPRTASFSEDGTAESGSASLPSVNERNNAAIIDDADVQELDELERQSHAAENNNNSVEAGSRHQRTSLSIPSPITVPNSSIANLGAPQINGASTPRPFGESLPTPEIISRDLTRPSEDGGGRKSSIGGGVTSAGLVDPNQKVPAKLPADAILTSDRKRRPSSTGPILCALGCGTMGRSILSGVLDSLEEFGAGDVMSGTRLLPPSRFIACVRRETAATKLIEEWGDLVSVVRGSDANAKAVSDSDYIILGCKPQVAREILTSPDMQSAIRGKVLISILAGTTIASLQQMCPDTKIIRVMPNTPSRIRKGMSVIVSGTGVSESHLEVVSWIFNQVGKTLIMDEKHIDAATAMCGSGPAFMAVILESMTDGGVMMGIPRAQAEELAAQTMLGTASMVQAGQHPALIRNNVATPGGCTIGGLLEMEDGKIRSTMARTIQTATNIAAGLGK